MVPISTLNVGPNLQLYIKLAGANCICLLCPESFKELAAPERLVLTKEVLSSVKNRDDSNLPDISQVIKWKLPPHLDL